MTILELAASPRIGFKKDMDNTLRNKIKIPLGWIQILELQKASEGEHGLKNGV